MTREELREHCEKQIEMCEFWAIGKGEKPSGKIYEEHKLILELLEQAPFINKPCVSSEVCEHDKNKVLDKIRAEIETKYGQCDICKYFVDYDYNENDISEYRPIGDIADILQIIDKYKAETENT